MAQQPGRGVFDIADEHSGVRVATRYRVDKTLGRGGMGSVFKVFDESTSSPLALKRPTRSSTSKERALFEREYHTLCGIRHPHIVEVYDYGADERGPFYTMELLVGGDLSNSAPMAWPEVCRIMRDAASALALLHARRLIHRDLSARNLWRCPDGRIKVIDFGALAAFGTAGDVAGTAPFIAPEALHGQPLDQRTDLYSLGALGYWLLTGRHAFPARELYELEEHWRRTPRPPSMCVERLDRTDLPALSPALDALIEALLSRDPLGRPGSAGEVIERLAAVAKLPTEKSAYVLDSYLGSATFVGRQEQRAALTGALRACAAGKSTSVRVEAEAGMGSSRLLQEFALEARLAGFIVLHTDAQGGARSHAAVSALALRVLDALPTLAKSCASVHAPVLGHLSPELARRLGLNAAALSPMPHAPGEARMRIQAALRAWFLAIARVQPLALLVDDLDVLDEASAAWLAALTHEAKQEQLLVVATLGSEGEESRSLAVEAYCQQAQLLSLPPLTVVETRELLHSMFGDAAHLERVAELLFRISGGHPAPLMELAEYLVKQNLALYLNGSWVLPQTLEEGQLPATRAELLAARLRRLDAEARGLGQVLSIHPANIPLEVCFQISGLDRQKLFAALERLVKEGVLTGSDQGYRFCDDGLRRTLLAELDAERSRRAHKALGEILLASSAGSTREQLEAGVHLLLGGDQEQGSRVVAQAGLRLGLIELTDLGPASPWLAEALTLFQAQGRPEVELVPLLSPLALAGYYADRRLADRHGEQAVAALSKLLHLPLAQRLRPFLGKKLSLYVAFGAAALKLLWQRKNPCLPGFRDAVVLLFNCVAALTGVATICIDPQRAQRYARVIEPLTALGKNHVASLMHEFCLNLAATVQDHIGETYRRWTFLLQRLEANQPIKNLPDNLRVFYLAGALYARGVMECWRDDSRALDFADRLDALRLRLYEMSADQIRMMYYGNQGNTELFERYRQRVELHAIQRGTAWQVETWASGAAITVYLRTNDAARMRDSEEQLRALSREVPSLQSYAVRARGCSLLLRGLQSEGLPHLEAVRREPVKGIAGWGRSHGALARGYNELGAHTSARDVCLAALAMMTPEDRAFPAMNMGVELELAIAEAGLGQLDAAAARLDALLERHAPHKGPLTLGALHEARAKVAQQAGDMELAARHLDEMQRWYRGTQAPGLVERCDRFEKQLRRSRATSDLPPETVDAETVMAALRYAGTGSRREQVKSSLRRLLAHLQVDEGFLFASGADGFSRVADVGEVNAELDAWASARLGQAPDALPERLGDVTVTDHNEIYLGRRSYRLLPLRTACDGAMSVVGGLVVPSEVAFKVPGQLLHALASRLVTQANADDA